MSYKEMKRVIIESPYAGDIKRNIAYARAAVNDCLHKGEAPIVSHLLFTQPGVLNDDIPEERKLGIDAGHAWLDVCELVVFYTDYGWSKGMIAAKERVVQEGKPFEERRMLRARHEPRNREIRGGGERGSTAI